MTLNNQIKLFPSDLEGSVIIPPSKSISHRAIICASLSNGTSHIDNIIYSDDINATISAMEALGAKFRREDTSLIVEGVKKIRQAKHEIDCNESGSTLRFLIPIVSLSNKKTYLTGKESLLKRPLSVYDEVFKSSGSSLEYIEDKIMVNGSIKAKKYYINGQVSSQFISGLLFSLPLLKEDSEIIIDGPFESRSYVDLTIDVLDHFGIEIKPIENGFFIEGNQKYSPADYTVEGDYSQAAYFLVAGLINRSVKTLGLDLDSIQGDSVIIDIIKDMKGRVIFDEEGYITVNSSLNGTTIDLSNCPDLGPILALLASLSKGTTKLINAQRLKIKESDRILSTVTTLKKLGVNISSTHNSITIEGRKSLIGGVELDSFNDHRIAMMIAIAASNCDNPITLSNPQAVRKSYPHFYEDYKKIGGKIK